SADDDPRAEVQPAVHGPGNLPADVVEIDVDVLVTQRVGDASVPVVDRRVVAVHLGQLARLLWSAGDPDGAASGKPRELPDDLPDGAGSARDDDRVAGPRLPHVEEPEVRGQAGCPEDVQRERRRVDPGRHAPQRAAAGDRVLLPAELPDDEVAGGEASVVALDHFPEALRRDHIAELERPRVASRLAHASPLIRVDRDVVHMHEDLTAAWSGNVRFVECEVRLLRKAVRSRGQRDPSVHASSIALVRLGFTMGYAPPGTNPIELVALAQEAERLGYDSGWAAEAWGTDAVTVLSWLAATTSTIKVGSAILQIPGRTPANTAMTAATLDLLSGGRVLLGLGTSGPQVVE